MLGNGGQVGVLGGHRPQAARREKVTERTSGCHVAKLIAPMDLNLPSTAQTVFFDAASGVCRVARIAQARHGCGGRRCAVKSAKTAGKNSASLASVAYHEAGHAVADWRHGFKVKSATIVPKDDSLGRVSAVTRLHLRSLPSSNPSGATIGRYHEL